MQSVKVLATHYGYAGVITNPLQVKPWQSPKLLTAEQVAEALDLSEDTLARYRANGTGPNFLKVGDGGNIRYLEEDVIAYLHSSRQLPPVDGNKAATPAAIQAAIVQGRAGVREALNERHQQMKALDDADRDSLGVTPLTVTGVGETPDRRSNVSTRCRQRPSSHLLRRTSSKDANHAH